MAKKTPAKSRKGNKALWIGALLALLIVIVASFAFYLTIGWKMAEERKMTDYLQDRYGKEFVVNNIRITGSGIGVEGSIRGDAYPKSDPTLKFELRKSQASNDYDYDSYLSVLWSRQGRSEAEGFMKTIGGVRSYELKIDTSVSFSGKLIRNTPSLQEITQTPKPYSYFLAISSVLPVTESQPSDTELRRAYEVVQFIKSQSAAESGMQYSYGSSDAKEGARYAFTLKRKEEINSVKQPSDLKAYFKINF